ncbi:hypothetical protein [Paraburkholderia sp.]|uniref:hypothetical protein n=1 Tax=Paraburkholderia sp. TaxID=1926495 RepID=UPI003D6FFE8F
MEKKRMYQYMAYEMTSGVDGDHTKGFYVTSQVAKRMGAGTTLNVPITGIASGRFPTEDNAFDASFDLVREAIDRISHDS